MDYTTKKFDETNTGILFENTENWELAKQGKLNVDGEEFRVIGIYRKNKDQEVIMDIYRSIGTLKQNGDKSKETHPDSKGVINITKTDGNKIISAWKKVSSKGNHYTSVALRNFDDANQITESNETKIQSMIDEEVENIRNTF